jgi:glutathione S-transferase
MTSIAVVTSFALIEYLWISFSVGQARTRYGVAAPATTGNEIFERWFRVQQNTVEQLVVFLPSLWLFGHYVNARLGALIGLAFVAGRYLYARGYVEDPQKRGRGFMIGFAATALLLAGGLIGALWSRL